jgi:RNA polymerase sigma factor (sigma-70 family)
MATTIDTRDEQDPGRQLVLAVMGAHAGALLALARRHSLCADDAHDAYQRALEIFLRRADSLDPASAPAWLRTVVKHEAMAVRASRQRLVGPVEVDLDRSEARDLLPADERVAASQRAAQSTEALSRLKPQEVRALVLKARGYSYNEMAEITGWTYTKVNRCLTEGRRAFLDRFADIEAGRECERWTGTLSALADGEASAQELAAARPHLRHCPSCRARLREFRAAPPAVAAIAPEPVVLAGAEASEGPGLLGRLHDAVVSGWQDRVLLSAHKLQAGMEAVSAGKLVAVAASATALAGGGATALTEAPDPPAGRPAAAVAAPVSASPSSGDSTGDRDSLAPGPASNPPGPAPAEASGPTAGPPRPPAPAPAEFDLGSGAGGAPGSTAVSPAAGASPPPVRTKRPGSPPPRPASSSPSPSPEFGP